MNTKAIVGLIIIIAISLVGFLFLGNKTTHAPTIGTAPAVPSGGNTKQGQSLRALVEANKPVACTFASTTASGTESGTMYIANGMVAGDFTIQSANGNIDAHMITKDSTSYVWTSMSSVGFKSSVSTEASNKTTRGVDYNSTMNYKCTVWTPDAKKFDMPKSITFTSTSAFVPPNPNVSAGAGGNADARIQGSPAQCSACAQLPSQQKAQCLTALHC